MVWNYLRVTIYRGVRIMMVDVKDGANLKPCPFCGSKVHYTLWKNKWLIGCTNDKCRIQPHTDYHVNKSVIAREWNKRYR